MRRLLVLSLLAVSFASPAARADGPPTGQRCDFSTISVQADGQWTGYVTGGPVVAPGQPVTLRCSIHLDDASHAGPAAAGAVSVTGPGAAALPPTLVSFGAPLDAWQVVCTEAVVGATTWYWDGLAWTTDAAARCAAYVFDVLPEPARSVAQYAYCLPQPTGICDSGPVVDELFSTVDPAVCAQTGGDVWYGDVWLWDCPPYDEG